MLKRFAVSIGLGIGLGLVTLACMAAGVPFTVDTALRIIIKLVILGVIFYVIWWFIGYVAVPEPFNKVLRVLVGLVVVIILVVMLLPLLD
jgi:hypothetical protein